MKTYNVTIGGRERPLKFSLKLDAVPLFKRFGKPLGKLCLEDCLGVDRGTGKLAGSVNPEAQIAVLWHGLKHDQPRLTEDQVGTWLDEAITAGQALGDVMLEVTRAAFASGAVGRVIDIDVELGLAEGKDPEPAIPPTIPAEN